MALDANIVGGSNTANKANVDAAYNQCVTLPGVDPYVGKALSVASLDTGVVSGNVTTRSIEVDEDFKIRMAGESLLDSELFDYTAQNTGKQNMIATTMSPAFTTGGFVTNNTSITTVNTGVCLRTYAMFPVLGSTSLYGEFEGSFSATPQTNTIIRFGFAIPPGAVPWTLVDGVEFRLNSSGLVGVISSNGTETQIGPFDFTGIDGSAQYTPNKKYQFIIQITQVCTRFFVDNIPVGHIDTPVGQGTPCMSAALSVCVSHAITGGAAGGAISFTLSAYTVSMGGMMPADTLAIVGNRIYGAYQGLSGGTMGSLATYPNSTNPTAAVPSNTALTANLLAGLGGQVWETATLAVTPVDGILMSYQVPMGTVSIQGRRMSIKGIYLSTTIQTIMAGGPLIKQYCLAWGHTAVSLATGEAATTKAPRRIALPPFQQIVALNQAAGTIVSQVGMFMDLGDAGIIVNPGEFIALVTKHVGTVMTSGTFAHQVQLVYGWI